MYFEFIAKYDVRPAHAHMLDCRDPSNRRRSSTATAGSGEAAEALFV